MSAFWILTQVALWVAVIFLYVSVFLIYRYLGKEIRDRQNSEATASTPRESGPKLGEVVDVVLVTVDGAELTVNNGQPHVIFFGGPRCGSCSKIQPLMKEFTGRVQTIVAYASESKNAAAYANAIGAVAVADPKREFAQSWNIRATPYLVAIDSTGAVVKTGSAATREGIEAFYAVVGEAETNKRKAVTRT